MIASLAKAVRVSNVEWELSDDMARTGRWRARQYYAKPRDQRVPSQRQPAEWRTGSPR